MKPFQVVKDFEEESGIDLRSWRWGNVGSIVKSLRDLGYGDGMNHVPKVLEQQENALRIALEKVQEVRAGLAGPAPTQP